MKKLLILTISLFFYGTVQAQNLNSPTYNNEGFFGNATLVGAAWNIDDLNVDTESGAGFGLKIGYNFNPNFGIFTSFDGANINPDNGENYALGHFDIDVHGIFRSTQDRFRPLVKASLIGMSAQDDDFEINGAGIGIGAGALISLTEQLALDINYTQGFVNISEVKLGTQTFEADENATTGRFFLGLAYHF